MNNHLERLKKYWKTDTLSFIATFSRYKIKEGFFNDFINPVSLKKLYYPEPEDFEIKHKNVSFYVPNASNLNDGQYYKVELEYSAKAKKQNNPYSLEIANISPLNQNEVEKHLSGSTNIELLKREFRINSILEKEAAKEHIRLRFERLNNPEANKIIANLMREIGKGMYSSKQRMIFELLQNADDAPGKEKVEFHIDTNGDYFFIMHDGAPFSKDDVDAITSAAESTKRKDQKKTGYKGIGFKSVFTDSSEVWLKSGGYQFAFIRNSQLFQDFESFYFSSTDYKEFPKLIERHRKKYQKDILAYNSITDIPWQVIPIWQDELPAAFNDSNFSNFDNPVQFALKVGSTNIFSEDGYLNAIENIVKRPQFLLFLRNTSKFRSPKNRVTVTRVDDAQKIKIEKTTVEYVGTKGIQHRLIQEYSKQIYPDIQVNNDAFLKLNIGLKKIVEKNDLNEDTFHFVDLDGNKIETIPPKLASANETEVAFGILLVNNKIAPEKEYIDGLPKYSSLFTYLPMEDTRFQLPFLVNADFVPSSDRQRIQGDNLWNKYIMIKVAEKHVETLAFYAEQFLTDTLSYGSYLSILLKNPLPDDDTAQHIIDSYNNRYLEALEQEEFIVNDKNKIQLLSTTILDISGFVGLFGNEIFYEIVETSKRLPHPKLEKSYLKEYEYLNVETIDLEQLSEYFNPEICELIGNKIATQELYNNAELLRWLNKLAKYIPGHFGKIPFIVHNNSLFSIERLLEESDAWLINENTKEYEKLFQNLGYHTVNLDLDKYSNIKVHLNTYNDYLNDKLSAYERIAANPILSKLGITSKLSLIDFLQNSRFMLGIGENKYFGELELFNDESGKVRPLQCLISRTEELSISSLNKFRLDEYEFENIPDNLRRKLVSKDQVFNSFILNEKLFHEWSKYYNSENIDVYVSDLKIIYSWIENPDEISSASWASIPWLYIDDNLKFLSSDKVYWSSAFYKMPSEDYDIINSILNSAGKVLPIQVCGEIIKSFKIKTDDNCEIEWEKINDLETVSANVLLDWLETDGRFSDFFQHYTFQVNSTGSWTITHLENAKVFDGSEIEIKDYIQSHERLKPLFIELDKSLCSDNRSKIGLLQSEKLLRSIIDSKCYDQNLAVYLPSSIPFELLQNFILNLSEYNLKTSNDYGTSSPEHIIIHNLLRTVEDINAIPAELIKTIETLREKIAINQNPLSNYDLSNRVQFGKGDEKKILNLSDILKEFEGESDVLDKIIESFSAITEKSKLRKLIFKTRQMNLHEICKKIEAEPTAYYSPHQVVFQLLFEKYQSNKTWEKFHFDNYYKNQGDDFQLQSSYQVFLDILFELDFVHLNKFYFLDLDLKYCVDKNFSIESEHIPLWLEEWINRDSSKRTAFISKLGYNDINSSIVKLRKASISVEYDQNVVIRYLEESKPNMQIIWNTLVWLSNYNTQIITQNIDVIKQVNNYVKFKSEGVNTITIPVITTIDAEGKRTYKLQSTKVKSQLLKISHQTPFVDTVFSTLNKSLENPIFIDDSIGRLAEYYEAEDIELEEHVDIELLESDSNLWEELFYKKWENFHEYPIYIFNGNEIPFLRTFKGITINKFTQNLMFHHNGKYFVSHLIKNDLINNLSSIFPEAALSKLKDWHYKTLQNESLLEEDSFTYRENIDRLLQDRLGLSFEEQKRESGNAKTHAVYFLYENGYDVSNVNNAGASLTNLIDPDGKRVSCIVRSAKGGLLYIDKEHWDMLEYEHMFLIVIYPGNTPRLFKNRLELLHEELAENVLFRIPNQRHTSEIDGVFNELKSESHLILVTSEKMKESLFSKLKTKKGFDKGEIAAVGGEDFKF